MAAVREEVCDTSLRQPQEIMPAATDYETARNGRTSTKKSSENEVLVYSGGRASRVREEAQTDFLKIVRIRRKREEFIVPVKTSKQHLPVSLIVLCSQSTGLWGKPALLPEQSVALCRPTVAVHRVPCAVLSRAHVSFLPLHGPRRPYCSAMT